MKSKRRKINDGGTSTRTAILNATEAVMREEGYAAVTSRRIAESAELKSQLVHYHFGTMDDLFLALLNRVEESHFSRYAKVFSSRNPLRALWDLFVEPSGTELMMEFTALAGHRKAVRKEIARCIERARRIEVAVVSEVLSGLNIERVTLPPTALAVLLAGASRAFVIERAIGVSTGHDETIAFIKQLLETLPASFSRPRRGAKLRGVKARKPSKRKAHPPAA
jgi:TetR/AcrR family transcriptional regulator